MSEGIAFGSKGYWFLDSKGEKIPTEKVFAAVDEWHANKPGEDNSGEYIRLLIQGAILTPYDAFMKRAIKKDSMHNLMESLRDKVDLCDWGNKIGYAPLEEEKKTLGKRLHLEEEFQAKKKQALLLGEELKNLLEDSEMIPEDIADEIKGEVEKFESSLQENKAIAGAPFLKRIGELLVKYASTL